MRATVPRATKPPCPVVQKSPTTEEQRILLFELAANLGYSMVKTDKILKEIGYSIACRLKSRAGEDVYQTRAFCLPSISRFAAERILPHHLVTEETASCKMWEAKTMSEVLEMFRPLLKASGFSCAGTSRALKTDSEYVIRRLAIPIPSVEVRHMEQRDRLYINFQYVLADEQGDLHPPKDGQRNEIAMAPELVGDIRAQLLSDLAEMGEQGFPLSPAFWRQLGQEDQAVNAEAIIANLGHQETARTLSLVGAPEGTRRARLQPNKWEVESILEERPRGKNRFRVRWKGYHPSWERWRVEGLGEAGDPLETWEPLKHLKQTEALIAWRASAIVVSTCSN